LGSYRAAKKPDPAVNGKRRIQSICRYLKVFGHLLVRFLLFKIYALKRFCKDIKKHHFVLFAAHWVLWCRCWLLLAALWPLLERHAKIIPKSMPKMIDLDHPKLPKMTPKSTPKSTKNRCKKQCEKRTEIEPT